MSEGISEVIKGAKSFSRSIKVLQLIADQGQPPSLGDLLESSKLTRPTLYRVLSALEAEGLILRNGNKRYKLGSRLVSLAHRALAQTDIRDAARGALEQLRDTLGETVHLAIRNRDELVYIDKIESLELVRMSSSIGTRVPFHSSAVGKAFLTALDSTQAHALIDSLPMSPMTEHSSTSKESLKSYLKQVKSQGYSFESEENEKGIVCFGAAILNANRQPEASVSVSVPKFRLKKDHTHYTAALMAACEAISRQLGWIE